MSYNDHSRPPEERIQQALAQGPDMNAPGRYGGLTRFVRRLVGRAVAYERDYGLQIDVALLERLHEIEAVANTRLNEIDDTMRDAHRELRDADQRLRDFTEQLLDNDHRALRDTQGALARIETLEQELAETRARLQDVDTRSAVANTIATGAADALESIAHAALENKSELELVHDRVVQLGEAAGRLRGDADKASFVYDELTAMPYLALDHQMIQTDTEGRSRLGYRGTTGPSPLYVGFEDIFRGSQELIRERQRVYLDVLANRGTVVDLGCGRGEMLQLLVGAGIDARGVDLDEAMVDRARKSGVEVMHGDALEFLVKQEDASIGAIFSAQFIEHLPAALLPELLEIARTKLVPGGVFVAETVNPHSPRALKVFWVDPTHQHPLFPETMLALCQLTGFEEAEIMFPLGTGNLATDLRTCGEYALIAGGRGLA